MNHETAGVARRVVALLLCLGAARFAHAGIESRVALHEFAPLTEAKGAGQRVRLERIAIGDTVDTLELERFEVWAPDAEIVLEVEGGTRQRLARPTTRFYRGTVSGDPESIVFLSMEEGEGVQGLILSGSRRFNVRTERERGPRVRQNDASVFVNEVTGDEDAADGGGFTCAGDAKIIRELRNLPGLSTEVAMPVASTGTLSGTATYTLNIAIDTDYELFTDFGGATNPAQAATSVQTFVANVVGAASTIYRRDLRTDLVLVFTRVSSSASDPFNVTPGATGTWTTSSGTSSTTYSTYHALAELGDVWHNSAPYAGPRSSVVLLSGKAQTAGLAWMGTSCGPDFLCAGNCGSSVFETHYAGGYAYIGLGTPTSTSAPNPDATNGNSIQYGLPAGNYWPLLGFAHELGHNVNGPHTHCVPLSAGERATYSVPDSRNWVDECATQSGCFGGTTQTPIEQGTVMSYCHNRPAVNGYRPSRFLFGKTTEASNKILQQIGGYISGVTPNSATISVPASVNLGVGAAASVISPVAGQTYSWTATNATITGAVNGAFSGTAITFTSTANPVTLHVRATGANGCAATEHVVVNVVTCVPASIATQPSSVSIWSGSTTQLSVVAGGNSPAYQWYMGASGDTSSPVGGATSATLNVTPASTTSYWVRVTTTCSGTVSVDSSTATVTVTTPGAAGTTFNVLTPCRIVDSRQSTPLNGDSDRTVAVSGKCGVPAGARAVAVNLTAVSPSQTGFFALYIGNTVWGGTSTMNYRSGKTRANNAVVPLSPDGKVGVRNGSTVSTHFIIDVSGYFE